ncbi:MAG: hypothetical protein NVSMB65_02350 [Chloroflexota bacterium]
MVGAGDALVFVLFAWTGRSSHGEATGTAALGAVLGTAAPFLAAWFAMAAVLGTYRARDDAPRALLGRAALTWLLAWPVGLLLRAVILRRGIPPSFAAITLIVNMALLLAWRALAAGVLARRARRTVA